MTDASPADADRKSLIEIIAERSFQSGAQMKLASGRSSSFYFNMKPTMMHPEGGHLIAASILAALRGDNGELAADLIGGLEMGAVPLAAAVAAVSHEQGTPLPAFFVRKQVKAHGTQKLIEGLAPGESLSGKRVVIVEDVTTTGGSALKAVELVKAEGARAIRVITVVDRLEGAAAAFDKAGVPFTALLTADDFKS